MLLHRHWAAVALVVAHIHVLAPHLPRRRPLIHGQPLELGRHLLQGHVGHLGVGRQLGIKHLIKSVLVQGKLDIQGGARSGRLGFSSGGSSGSGFR